MSTYLKDMGLLTIQDATLSNVIGGCEDCETMYLFSNSQTSASVGTITVQISAIKDAATSTTNGWADLTSGGSDVTIAAGNACPITDTGFYAIRVRSSGTETPAISFRVVGRFKVGR